MGMILTTCKSWDDPPSDPYKYLVVTTPRQLQKTTKIVWGQAKARAKGLHPQKMGTKVCFEEKIHQKREGSLKFSFLNTIC